MSFVDERIVKMVFDNSDFAQKINGTINSITQLNKATDQVANNSGNGISAMSKAFQQAEITSTQAGFHIRDVWLKVASILEYQVAGKIIDVGKKIANAMSFEGIADGFKEYELKMGSVQTIMAGTGASLQEVNNYLEELNRYSDKTIYSFADMTNNIGKFTNAGVELEDAVLAIKGIANEAARSGANANEASRAMYNFSQALSAGYVKLIDWKSIENANMATKEFKDTLLEVASAAGTVEKSENGMYKVLSKNANGGAMKEAMSATKNFNDSLAYQWMTTDVLTKTMKIYATDVRDLSDVEKQAWESELRTMGFNEEQIKKFEALGSAATDAASEVKTFSMLIDTLKEAIGSGWAQTWEILIGDFEEAKKLWTEVSNVLGGLIDETSKSRNELLKGWDALGGRAALIDALRRAFEAVVAVVKPIGQAFRNIFPPMTAKKLLEITKGIQRFSASLMISEETAKKVRQAASGFFAVFDIGAKFVSAFVKAIFPATKGVSSLGGFFLDLAARIGNFLTKVDIIITKTNLFERVFKKIGDTIKPVVDIIKTGFSGARELVEAFLDGFSSKAGATITAGNILKGIFESIGNGLKNLYEKIKSLSPIFEGLTSLVRGLGKALGTVFKQMGDSISGISFGGNGIGGVMNIFNALLSGGIMYSLYSGVKQFSKFGEGFNKVLDGLGNALDSFGKKIGSETLLNSAKAVALLAGSLVLVAMVDTNKLAGATTAITALVGGLAGAITLLMKATNSFSTKDVTKTFSIFGKDLFGINASKMIEMSVTLGAVSKALVAMGSAVLLMSVGLKIVSSAAEGGHLWDSFAVVSLMLAELTGVAILLGKFGGKATKGASSLKGMTTALILMAAALKIVSSVVEGGAAWESLGILSIMLGELTGVVLLIENFGKYELTGMMSLISLAISLNLCVAALKSVSDALGNEGNHIWESLGIISLMLAELAGITILMSNFGGFAALGGMGAIMAAAALLILVQSLKQINTLLSGSDNHVWQSLGVIGASLSILAVGLAAMAVSLPGAAGLLVASAGLVVLGGALKIMGSLKLSEIGKGLLAMAGSMIILAAGLTAMVLALPGAAALVVAAAGLTILAGVLKVLGSMSLGEIIKALASMAVALGGIAAISIGLSLASPAILIFSAALLVFGAALISTGVGLTLFSAGLQALVAVIPMGVVAINMLATCLLNLIPIIAEKLMDALAILCQKIVEYAPLFTETTIVIIDSMLQAIVESSVKFGEAVLALVIGMINVLTQNVPKMAKAGSDFIIAYLNAISVEIPRIVEAAYQCAIALINGLADAIRNNNGDLINAVDNLMQAVIQAITQWLVRFTPLGLLIPENVKKGISDGTFNVKGAMEKLMGEVISAIRGFFDKAKQAAEYVIGGLIEGLKGSAVGKAVSAAMELGGKVIDGLNSSRGLDEHSYSHKAIQSGEYVALGTAEGIRNKTPEAVDASETLGDKTIGALSDKFTSGADDISTSTDSIIDDFTNLWKNADVLTTSIDKNTESLGRWGTTSDIEHKKVDRWGTTWEREHGLIKDTTEVTDKNTESIKNNTDAIESNTKASGKATKASKAHADSIDHTAGVVDAFVAKYGHLYEELGDDGPIKVAQFAVRKLAEETYNASIAAENAAGKNKQTKVSIEEMMKAFSDLREKMFSSIKSELEGESFFMDKFEMKTEKTMANVLENMKSHIDGVTSWSNKMAELGEKGVNQGILKYLMELGPKGYELVNAFSNATTEEIAQANTMFEQAAALPDQLSNNTLASYAKAGLNCVAGFAGGIDKNVAMATMSADNVAKSSLKALETPLEINSPSKATFRDGVFLVQGLANGIRDTTYQAINASIILCTEIKKVISSNLAVYLYTGYGKNVVNGITSGISTTTYLAVNAATSLCNQIKTTISNNLTEANFREYGKNVARGLADGMSSDDVVSRVRHAAERLCEIADAAVRKYNEIASPSKLYKRYGKYIAQGLADGIYAGEGYAEKSATMLSQAIEQSLTILDQVADHEMEIHPVISPVLDLSRVRANASAIGNLFPAQSLAMASSIGIGSDYISNNDASTGNAPAAASITFTQNNYSPKALNRYEIYRNTKNQISQLKGALV